MSPKADSAVARGAALRSLSLLTSGALNALTEGVLVFDRRLRIVSRNRAADAMLPAGATAAQVLQTADTTKPSADWSEKLHSVLNTGRSVHFDHFVCEGPDGVRRVLDITVTALRSDEGGAVTGGLLAAQDVSESARLQARLAAAKTAVVPDSFATRLAHELNNTLDGVLRCISLALRRLAPDDSADAIDHLKESQRGLERIVQMVRELLGHPGGNRSWSTETNINRVVEEALRSMQDRASERGVVLTASYRGKNMPDFEGPILFQVCCNVIKNALDAMPEGGRLTVTTAVVGADVVLQFEDTGVGLPDDVEKVFDPFYSTKGQAGTGLGLAICRDFLKRFDGSIVAAARDAGGSIFTVRIPVARCSPRSADANDQLRGPIDRAAGQQGD